MKEFTKEEIVKRVSEAIQPCDGILITMGCDGYPHARVMEDHNPYDRFEFWFATNARTRKIGEIEAHPEVCIYYQPPSVAGYIGIMGTARVRTDEQGRHFVWREEWAKYYGDPMSPDFVPIQVIPNRIEFYDTNIGAHADDGFAPVVVDLCGVGDSAFRVFEGVIHVPSGHHDG